MLLIGKLMFLKDYAKTFLVESLFCYIKIILNIKFVRNYISSLILINIFMKLLLKRK